jgi:hypothetical protein
MSRIPPELGSRVSTKTISWLDQVMKAWGSEFHAPDHRIYQFGGGNNKDSTDMGLTGIYGVDAPEVMLLDGTKYPDMRDGIVDSFGVFANGYANNGFGDYKEVAVEDNTPSRSSNLPYIPPTTPSTTIVWGTSALSILNSTVNVQGVKSIAVSPSGVAIFNTTTQLHRSLDWGRTWTAVAQGGNSFTYTMAYANGIFLTGQEGAVGYKRSINNGQSWTSPGIIGAGFGGGVVAANGKFYYMRSGTTNGYWSTDGLAWNLIVAPTNANGWTAAAYGNGKVVIIAIAGADAAAVSSDNGLTFSAGGVPQPGYVWNDIAFANGVFCITQWNAGTTKVATSPDGVTWTVGMTLPGAATCTGLVVYQGNFFVFGPNNGKIYWSADGLNWAIFPSSSPPVWWSTNSSTIHIASDGGSNILAVVGFAGPFTGAVFTIP